MKLRLWYGIVLNLFLAALAVSGAALYVVHFKDSPKTRILVIRDTVSGKTYGRWPLEEFDEFAIEFIHSVNQSPVRETYRIEDGKLWPESVRFYSFGAGMQSDLEEGQKLSRDGDAMIISGFSSSFKELNYIIGTVSDHILYINNEIISLRELCGRNAQITMQYR